MAGTDSPQPRLWWLLQAHVDVGACVVRMKIRRTGGRTPVVLAEKSKARRRLARERGIFTDAETLTGPLPGSMLVLLSRLHRSEHAVSDEDERGA
ncbi:hypothetical protein [Methylobacterium sp. J-068]|uniref:hypothetical protein n=1 Tax=Methylobacterium sp. J-068 TaxID=2836649 RepID=UPI001FBBE248|nr:hypothetical protein [Methylobacterium sp. J-068]